MSNGILRWRTRFGNWNAGRFCGVISALCLLMICGVARAETVSFSGNTTGAPRFNRPDENGSSAPTTLSGDQISHAVRSVEITTAGSYTFTSTARYDNFTLLYSTALNSAQPLANCIITNDNLSDNRESGFTLTLQPGSYQFINTAENHIFMGPFSSTISGPGPIGISLFVVTSTIDKVPDSCTVNGNGCSLREAIDAANANPDDSTIEFSPAMAGSSVALSRVGDSAFGPTALYITTPIIINGLPASSSTNGITITRNTGVANLRLFRVSSSGTLMLRNLTLSGGTSIGGNGSIGKGSGGGGAGLGGAIIVGNGGAAGGRLFIENCTLSGNSATGGSGGLTSSSSSSAGGVGGGVGGSNNNRGTGNFVSNGFNGGPGGFGGGGSGGNANIVIGPTNEIKGGKGGFGGGGGGFFGNGSGGRGGFGGGDGGDISGRGGGGGGLGSAILNYGGTVFIINSTFANNTAKGGTASGDASAGSGFGTVFNGYGFLLVSTCTFSGNVADEGGGIFNNGDGTGNVASLRLDGTILANSLKSSGAQATDYSARASSSSSSQSSLGLNNLIRIGAGGISTPTITSDPNLGALAENGGPTKTFALSPGSPALDTGRESPTVSLLTDQRGVGFARKKGIQVDVGSFELAVNDPPVAVGPDSLSTPQNVAKTVALVGTDNDTTDTLTFIITTLPTTGTLFDGTNTTTPISTVPYTLTDAQHRITFRNSALGSSSFRFKVNDGALDSTFKTVNIDVTDGVAPAVSISTPKNNTTVSTLPILIGTAADNTGVVRVDLYLQRKSDNKFWNGTAWAAPVTTLSTVLTGVSSTDRTWLRTSTLPTGADLLPGAYFTAARAFDPAGNATSVTSNFTVVSDDTVAPTIAITTPANNAAVSTLPLINGTANDNVGVVRVDLYLQRKSDDKFWNGTAWAAPVTTLSTVLNGANWTRNSGLPTGANLVPGLYFTAARAFDVGNNGTSATRNFTVVAPDTVAPTIAITTPSNNATVSALPVINGTAADNTGVVRVDLYLQRKSDDKFWNGTAWAAPVTTLSTVLNGFSPRQWSRTSGLPTGADLLPGLYFTAARAFDSSNNGTSATRNFTVAGGAAVAMTSTIQLSSAIAQSDGTIRLTFTGALAASDATNYLVNNGAIAIAGVSQPDASTVEIKAGALISGARIAVAYQLQDAQGRSLKGSANVVVK